MAFQAACLPATRAAAFLASPNHTGAPAAAGFTGIANTMDLPERLLPKISSRMGALRRLQFMPYTPEQMETIIRTRVRAATDKPIFQAGQGAAAVWHIKSGCS